MTSFFINVVFCICFPLLDIAGKHSIYIFIALPDSILIIFEIGTLPRVKIFIIQRTYTIPMNTAEDTLDYIRKTITLNNFFCLIVNIQAPIYLRCNRKKTNLFDPIKRTCNISNLLIDSIILLSKIDNITVKMTM